MSSMPPPVPSPMQPISPAAPVENAAPPLSQLERVVNTFVAPSKTFEDIRRSANWWLPVVLMSILGITYFIMIDKKVGFDTIMQKQFAESPRMQQLSPEQLAQQIHISALVTKVFGYFTPVLIVAAAMFIGLVLWGVFNFLLNAELTFWRSVAIVIYSWLPSMLTSILAIATVSIGDPDNFNFRNPVATNPAYFMDPLNSSKFLYGMAMSLDIISIWIIVLMGIGFSVNSEKKKVKPGTAIATIAAIYFIVKLCGAGIAAALS
jgi:hypothetical protein